MNDCYFILASDAPGLNRVFYSVSGHNKTKQMLKKRELEGHENTLVRVGVIWASLRGEREYSRLKEKRKTTQTQQTQK